MNWEFIPGEKPIMLKIGPLNVPVLSKELEESTFGEYHHFPEPVIKINYKLNNQARAMTLLHEVLECIDANYGLELEESTICTLEQALTMVVRDNPEKFEEWTSRILK
jgi:hypothetical protein